MKQFSESDRSEMNPRLSTETAGTHSPHFFIGGTNASLKGHYEISVRGCIVEHQEER